MKADLHLRYPEIHICRVKGINRRTREVPAWINLGYTKTVITRTTAAELGYLEVTSRLQDLEELFHERVTYFLTLKGIERAYVFKLKQLSLGSLSRRNFPVVVLEEEVNPHLPVDLVLGLDFFTNHKLLVDTKKKRISIMSSSRK